MCLHVCKSIALLLNLIDIDSLSSSSIHYTEYDEEERNECEGHNEDHPPDRLEWTIIEVVLAICEAPHSAEVDQRDWE